MRYAEGGTGESPYAGPELDDLAREAGGPIGVSRDFPAATTLIGVGRSNGVLRYVDVSYLVGAELIARVRTIVTSPHVDRERELRDALVEFGPAGVDALDDDAPAEAAVLSIGDVQRSGTRLISGGAVGILADLDGTSVVALTAAGTAPLARLDLHSTS